MTYSPTRATAAVWIAPTSAITAVIVATSVPFPAGMRQARRAPPTASVVSNPAPHQAARSGVSDESMTASSASWSSFRVEYFVSPAVRAWRSYQTGSCRKPVQATSERR